MVRIHRNKRKLASEIKDYTNKIQKLKDIQRRSSVAKNILLRDREVLIDQLTSVIENEDKTLPNKSKKVKKTNNYQKVKLLK